MKKLRILLLFLILLAVLLTACGTSPQLTPTATETPLPSRTHTPTITRTPTITYTPKPTDTPTISPSPTIELSPTIPSEWKNWNGTIKDFDSYFEIKELSDLDKIIAYDRSQQTTSTDFNKACNLKIHIASSKKVLYSRLEYDRAGKGCTEDTLPAKEFFGARLNVNNAETQDTLLFYIQKRYTPEGQIYMKYVASKSYIDQAKKMEMYKIYYSKIYEGLSKGEAYLTPIVDYASTDTFVTGSFDYLREVLSSLGYTYDKAGIKEMLTQWAAYSQDNKSIPQELREKIEKSIFFFSFCLW